MVKKKNTNAPKKGGNNTIDQKRQVVKPEDNELREAEGNSKYLETQGKVVKVESGRCKVSVKIGDNEIIVDAYVSGHLKINKIRIIQGDVVTLLIPPMFDPQAGPKGRITHRKDTRNQC